jgi:uncharacterized BrkB/YihY/UPF0761 family membrane protein
MACRDVAAVAAVPITLRLLVREDQFTRGPFHLGRWSKPIAAIAFCWALFACYIFVLPQVLPVTAEVRGSLVAYSCSIMLT